jgi:hypothetical protein
VSRAVQDLQLINLDDPSGAGDFLFHFFPTSIETKDRANYEALDVAGFVKPISYSNTEPQAIEFPEVWLDTTDADEGYVDQAFSVLPDIERLRALMRRPVTAGGELADAPPRLMLIVGDWTPTVVLVEMRADRKRFSRQNIQNRAILSLTFWEVRDAPGRTRQPQASPARLAPLTPADSRAVTGTSPETR